MFKVGTKVNTPHGLGMIIDYDLPDYDLPDSDCWRYIVTLKNNPFSYDKVCYFHKEVTKVEERIIEIKTINK